MEDSNSNSESIERERSSSENVTIIAETFSDGGAGATVSSLKSENSTEHLICKTPQQKGGRNKVDTRAATPVKTEPVKKQPKVIDFPKKSDVSLKSDCYVDKENEKSRLVLLLGLGQLFIGVFMVVFGALVIVHNASLSRVGAGLWSGCVAIATGMIGVLAGINDCYGRPNGKSRRNNPFLTAFLALSLASLAASNMAAVLAGTGIYRDTNGNKLPTEMDSDIEDEKAAWTPVLTNIGLLIISTMHCLLAIISIYHSSKRVCSCLRAKEPFNHNQFYPDFKTVQQPYVIVSEKSSKAHSNEMRLKHNELCKELEIKLSGADDANDKRVRRTSEGTKEGHGSANSKDKLVTSWLGRHPSSAAKGARPPGKNGVRKMKMKPQPIVLVPAHPASTMGRAVPISMMPVAPRYATLPILHPPPPAYRGTIYYPMPAAEMAGRRRRRSPRSGRNRVNGNRGDNRLTRSLERMHRNAARDKALTDADVIKTYTGLDRAIAEQFIEACNETRNTTTHPVDKTDSSGFDTASSECHSNRF